MNGQDYIRLRVDRAIERARREWRGPAEDLGDHIRDVAKSEVQRIYREREEWSQKLATEPSTWRGPKRHDRKRVDAWKDPQP